MGYNDLARDWDPRGAFLVSDTFARRPARRARLGRLQPARPASRRGSARSAGTAATASAASARRSATCRSTRPRAAPIAAAIRTFRASPRRRACPTRRPTRPNMTRPRSPANVHPRLPRYGRLTHEQERLGVTFALQAEPWEGARFTVDVLHARLQATRQEDFLEAISFSRTAAQGGKPQTSVVDAEYDANGNLLVRHVQRRRHPLGIALRRARHQILAISAPVGPGDHRPAALHLARRPLDLRVPQPGPDHDHARCAERQRLHDRLPRAAAASRPSPIRSTSTSTAGCCSSSARRPGVTPSNITPSEIRIRPQGADNSFTTFRGDFAWDVDPRPARR